MYVTTYPFLKIPVYEQFFQGYIVFLQVFGKYYGSVIHTKVTKQHNNSNLSASLLL